MTTLPTPTEAQIRNWSDPRSFSRGVGYFNDGSIVHPRLDEMTLKAECWGSAPHPYRVEIDLSSSGIASGSCSCPVGTGGTCKHAVALLLTWLHEPESFTEMETEKRALEERSKEELIQLIAKMIDRHPDLETLLEMPAPGAASGERTVDPSVIQRQVMDALPSYDSRGWGGGYLSTSGLLQVAAQGDDYADTGDWTNAAVVYETVAIEILDSYDEIYDDEGEVLAVVGECAEGLVACLANTESEDERTDLLEALFYIYRWDTEYGGVGAGDEAYVGLLEGTTRDEKSLVADWVRAELAQTDDSAPSSWRQQTYGRFLLQLEKEGMSDEAFLTICRETGRTLDLVERLLALGRVDEAAAEARNASNWDLTRMADLFRDAGHGDVVAAIIGERSTENRDLRPHEWLLRYRRETGDLDAALALARQIFERRGHLADFQTVREIAQEVGRHAEVVEPILRRLNQEKNFVLLTEIYVAAGQVDLALETLADAEQHHKQRWGHSALHQLRLKVANAAEDEHPDAAAGIYLKRAEDLIAGRGRDNYAQAAGYLNRVRGLYNEMGRQDVFVALVRRLRTKHSNLPAMQDEFDRASLPKREQ